jgi:hypothetical protein
MDSTVQSPQKAAAPTKRNRAALFLAPGGAAVAIALVLLRMHFEPPAVPEYSRQGPDETPLQPGGTFTLDLRPGGPVVGAVAARGFLLQGDWVTPWDPPFTVDVDGTVHIAGAVDTLFRGVRPGAWEVAVAVGRPEMLPTAPQDVLRARHGTSPATWHLVWERVRLQP